MLRHVTNITLNPFFQALVVAILIILIIPKGIEKYNCTQADMTTAFDKTQFLYSDLDHDGTSERIHTFISLSGNAGITLAKGIHTLDQWNFKGVYEDLSPRLMIGDFNNDNLDEVYIFTQVMDSILLNVLSYSPDPQLIVMNRFIAKLGRNLQDPDYLLIPGRVTDMNGDGSGDLVFSINAGHSRQPRKVFIYDIKNDTLFHSPYSGAFIHDVIMENVDDDPYPEFLLNTYASSNYNEEPMVYTDTSAWLMILDHDLRFLFEPVEFPGSKGGLSSIFIEKQSGDKMIMASACYGYPQPDTCILFLSDLNGRILKKNKTIIDDNNAPPGLMAPPSGYPKNMGLGTKVKEGFFTIDSNLEIKLLSNVRLPKWRPDFIDIDLDRKDEIIMLKPDQQKHYIFRYDFTHPVELNFPIQSTNPLFSVKLNGEDPPQLSVQGDREWKLFDYGINPVWRFRFLIWLGIYLAILAFIQAIRQLYSLQLKKRYETEKKIATLQLSSVKAQMEPHFIMNTINTIGSSIYRQKPDEAYQLLLNFSGMVRSLLLSSDKLTRSLKEEIEFVRNYLELEKTRFGDTFNYSLTVAEGINPVAIIPKMIIQLHTENAVKHGLLPKKSGGLLDISVTGNLDYIVITISDNGIGRNLASKNISQSTGKGMKILGQFFDTYNRHNKVKLQQEIIDLYDEERNPVGTMVKIFVPVDFNEMIF
jgi:two-component sensor histidine kinase